MLALKIKACEPPRNDLKVASVIGMTFLYDAGYSIVLLRPKNEVKLSTQSAEKLICMGKWPVLNWGNLFLGLSKSPRRLDFFRKSAHFQCPP